MAPASSARLWMSWMALASCRFLVEGDSDLHAFWRGAHDITDIGLGVFVKSDTPDQRIQWSWGI